MPDETMNSDKPAGTGLVAAGAAPAAGGVVPGEPSSTGVAPPTAASAAAAVTLGGAGGEAGGPAAGASQPPPVPPFMATTVPPSINIDASLPPVTAAGLFLAKFVLTILAGAIVILALYLGLMEWRVASDVEGAYAKVRTTEQLGTELLIVGALDRFATDIKAAQDNPTATWSDESLRNAQDILARLSRIPSATSVQKETLKVCIPPPAAAVADRDAKLKKCVELLGELGKAVIAAASVGADLQAASESTTKINEQRKALHDFWIQAAQLILLNLLLPILTALLGYIFGTQQAARTNGS
jgi:hypothetical protein